MSYISFLNEGNYIRTVLMTVVMSRDDYTNDEDSVEVGHPLFKDNN